MIYQIINYLIYYIRYVFTILMVALLLFVAYFAYLKLYISPIEEKALNEFFYAKKYFIQKKFKKALGFNNNKEEHIGFLGILKKYPLTKIANISNYYAGLCYYNIYDYKSSIRILKKFITHDDITPSLKYGIIGDAFERSNNNNQALKYYKKAAKLGNYFSIPFFYYKIGILYYFMNEYKKSLYYFLFLKKKYKYFFLSKDINIYIGLIKYKLYKNI